MSKYFIDCGAHCGESILRARQQFGYDITILSFEAVPSLAEELSKLYIEDPLVTICNAAVYVEDGLIDFNVCPAFTDGSSVLSTLNNNHLARKISVPCFDLSSWLRTSFESDDYIILKLDIEGAEYDVLEKMIADNTIRLVNELWGEWHYGHIVENLSAREKQVFDARVNNLDIKLKELNMELRLWEAYYTSSSQLTKRPASL